MKKPTLSVIMPNYNHAHYICEALEAILAQSFRPVEVIVIDDGSTDNSIEVIEAFAKRDPINRLLRNERNMGGIIAANRGLEHASGDYIYAAAADDRVLPGFFEKSINLLKQYPKAGLCCSDPIFFYDETGLISENRFRISDKSRYFSPDAVAKLIKKTPFWIAGHTSIVKKTALLEAGGYLPELRWHCDWFAMLVIAFRYGICYIPEPLAALRVSPNSYSASGNRQWSAQREVLKKIIYLLKSPSHLDVSPFFQRSCVLSCFGLKMIRLLIANPKYWNFISLRLVQRVLLNETLSALAPITPKPIKRLYRHIRNRPFRKILETNTLTNL